MLSAVDDDENGRLRRLDVLDRVDLLDMLDMLDMLELLDMLCDMKDVESMESVMEKKLSSRKALKEHGRGGDDGSGDE